MLTNIITTLDSIQNLYKKPPKNKLFIIPETGAFCEYQESSFFGGFVKLFHDNTPKLVRTYSPDAGNKKKFIQRCYELEIKYQKSIQKCGKNILWNASCKEKELENEQSKLAIVEIYKRFADEKQLKEYTSVLIKSFDLNENVERAICSLFEKIQEEIKSAIQKINIDLEFYLNIKKEEFPTDVVEEKELTELPNITSWIPPSLLEMKVKKKHLSTNEMVASINIKGQINKLEVSIENLSKLKENLENLFPKLTQTLNWKNRLVIDLNAPELSTVKIIEGNIPPPPPPCIIENSANQQNLLKQAKLYCEKQESDEQIENEFCDSYKELIQIIFFNEIQKGYTLVFSSLPLIEELRLYIDKTIEFNMDEIDKLKNQTPSLNKSIIKISSPYSTGYPPLLTEIQKLQKKVLVVKKQSNLCIANQKSQVRLEKISQKIVRLFEQLQKEQKEIFHNTNKNEEKMKEEMEKSESIQTLNHELRKTFNEEKQLNGIIQSTLETTRKSEGSVKFIIDDIIRFTECSSQNLDVILQFFKKKCNEYLSLDLNQQKEIYLRLYKK